MIIYFVVYVIIGLVVCHYMWNTILANLIKNISDDDYDKMKILFYWFGWLMWPFYLIVMLLSRIGFFKN